MCITIATASLILGATAAAAGTATTVHGQQVQAVAEQKAEKFRKAQMNLDVQRRRREIIREAQVARGLALNNAAGQGASEGTGLQGGLNQIAANESQGLTAQRQNLAIGSKIFDANAQAAKGQSIAAFGSGAQNIGGTLMDNNTKIAQIAGKFLT